MTKLRPGDRVRFTINLWTEYLNLDFRVPLEGTGVVHKKADDEGWIEVATGEHGRLIFRPEELERI